MKEVRIEGQPVLGPAGSGSDGGLGLAKALGLGNERLELRVVA